MASKKIVLLIQAIITFVIGIILANNGINLNPENWALNTGEELAQEVNQTSNYSEINSTVNQFQAMFQIFGMALSLASAVEFVLVILWIIFFKKGSS